MASRPAKKSETIEIRLSHAAKAAFMDRCRRERRTASDAIRLFIDGELDAGASDRKRRLPSWRTIAAGLIGAAIGLGVAAPSFAHATQGSRAAFERLDRNHDGVLSYEEFRSR
ncbi:MAG TPA: EF-hand domain-containing protein [Allosphingosinicella sp.]|nr:EF-hand domain-containing protein [Allosphingosinicella sp.]